MKKRKTDSIESITDNNFALIIDELRDAEPGPEREDIWYSLGDMGLAEEVRHLSYLMETENWTVKPEDRRALLEPADKPLRKLPPKEIEKIKADIAELANADLRAAWRAASRLGRRRGMVVDYIAEAAASPNEAVRYIIVHVLRRIDDPRTYPVILELTKDPVQDTRWWALETLGMVGKERAIPVLVAALDKSGEDFDGAVDGLKAVGKPAIPAIIDVLQTGTKEARIGAAWALSRIGDVSAIEPLSKLLADPDYEIRITDIESIAQMGEDHPETLGMECLELIRGMLGDSDERVRDNANYWQNELQQMILSFRDASAQKTGVFKNP